MWTTSSSLLWLEWNFKKNVINLSVAFLTCWYVCLCPRPLTTIFYSLGYAVFIYLFKLNAVLFFSLCSSYFFRYIVMQFLFFLLYIQFVFFPFCSFYISLMQFVFSIMQYFISCFCSGLRNTRGHLPATLPVSSGNCTRWQTLLNSDRCVNLVVES